MSWAYIFSVYVHILCAVLWIGGMLFLSLVLVPALRKSTDRKQALDLMISTGRRFKVIGWHVLVILFITGMMNIGYREWFSAGPAFWTSPIGMLLSWKIILFFIVLILAGLHDFWLGPRAGRLMQDNPDSPAALRARKTASWLGRINLLISLVIVLLAVMMIRGLPG